MTAAAPRSFFSSRFFVVLVSLALVLIALGGSVFRYLTASASITITQERPIAIATTFVPAAAPFSFSLLTSPETLLALEQADIGEQQAIAEAQQFKQNLLTGTDLNYDRDLKPWLGGEVTFALTELDLDADTANGQQPGYLLAAAIAPQKQYEAQLFLQSLWQRQSLSGQVPERERISGVRILHSNQRNMLTAASALIGDRFVLLANDVRVLRRSIRAAQSATNLAQNRAYRDAIAQLPDERVGLAYFDSDMLSGSAADMSGLRAQTAVSFELVPKGLLLRLRQADKRVDERAERWQPSPVKMNEPTAAMTFLSAASSWAINGEDFSQLLASRTAESRSFADSLTSDLLQPSSSIPEFFQWRSPDSEGSEWVWAKNDYALGKVANHWILVVKRDGEGAAQLDEAARRRGYSTVPVALDAQREDSTEATAWTRFKATQTSRASSGLETEVLGLHVPQDDYEIFTDDLSAIEQAITAYRNSLRDSVDFEQAIAALPTPNSGYVYLNRPTAAAFLRRAFPQSQSIVQRLDPLFSYVRSLSATESTEDKGKTVSVFIQMSR